jgi:hypothetical protein
MVGHKIKRRKPQFLKGFHHYVGMSKETRKMANRAERHQAKMSCHV